MIRALDNRDQRILIFAPTGRDAELTAQFLNDVRLPHRVCKSIYELCQQMLEGGGVVFLTEETLTPGAMQCLADALLAQPPWADIPIAVLTSGGSESPAAAEALDLLGELGNVNLIERPVRLMTLLSTLRTALRARNRQYDVRDHLEVEIRTKEELKRAFEEVEEASRLKYEFLATVSHELRTPLTSMLGWTEILKSHKLDEAGRARALETIERNARTQQQLIEDLLEVSRIITGKLKLDAGPIETGKFLDEAVESIRPTAEARQIKLQKIIQRGATLVYGDPTRLRQVIWNLLSNAIKFSPRGS